MSHAHELAEHIEHAGHAGHEGHGGGGNTGKYIGVTMAILGVMLAFCAAMVGSHRTELIKVMVEQANRYSFYQAETMKFRVMEADYELLKSLTPKADEVKKVEDTLRSKRRSDGKADDEDTAELKDLIASATEDMADLLTPDPEEKTRFRGMARRYEHDMKEAKEDAEAYEGAIKAHQDAAEWFERGQLAAEIGIVVASVALLMSSRAIWMISIAAGVLCAGISGVTFVRTAQALEVAEHHIAEAAKREAALEKDDDDDGDAKPAPAGSAAAKHGAEKAEKGEKQEKPEKAEKPAGDKAAEPAHGEKPAAPAPEKHH